MTRTEALVHIAAQSPQLSSHSLAAEHALDRLNRLEESAELYERPLYFDPEPRQDVTNAQLDSIAGSLEQLVEVQDPKPKSAAPLDEADIGQIVAAIDRIRDELVRRSLG